MILSTTITHSSSSSSSSSSKLFSCSSTPRVYASPSTLRISCSFKFGGGGGGVWRSGCSCLVFCTSKLRGMAEALVEKNSSSSTAAAAEVVFSSSAYDQGEISTPRTFLDASTEQDLLLVIQKEAEAGRLPINIAQGMEELYHNYQNAVLQSGHPRAHEIVLSNMAVALDRISMEVQDPFQFSSHHEAIRKPFDYYMFGQKYIAPLLDFRNSFLGNMSLFNEMENKLQQGENVILISNHQTEADPAIIALLLESTNPYIAENMISVAGDRVVTDPLCKPFSMGRNLLCVYSKKHMYDDPELVDMKKRANTKSLKELAMLLRSGSKIIWIAPSGGRDRPDPVTKEWYPAPFDVSSVDNMRRLAEHAGVPGHIYPLAVLCYDVMPPPLQVEKEIGEKRVISFHGVGLSVGPKISYQEITAALKDPEKVKMAYTQSLYSSVCEQYNVLKSAVHGKQGLNASTPTISLSQPWL
ncbi:Glycerol-3-phosphate 1-O-acyltransferase [Handroanthus impetiginosus]|uniref:Glycerol-3-phosphate acyltransferase, chloroplastic n=1 Tax=Handroanthus impetiginosus TaxID=429701 RepID=A0A2G9GZD3_9LAMI|nr:Glycerol-3-phosphate 1-O-acyltransferase [Handroanthus impetiginosus]